MMRRKSHLLLIFGGIVFLIYYKWKSASSDLQERSLGDINVDLADHADVEGEHQLNDQFDDALYYQGSENDTSADADLGTEVGEEGQLDGDHMEMGNDEQAVGGGGGGGGYLAQGGEEQLHLDIGQDQGAGQQPVLQQLPWDDQQQAQNVQEDNGLQQAAGDQQLIPDAQQQQPQQEPQQQVQAAQPVGQLEGQLQAGQQLLADQQQQQQQQLQADPQQPQNAQPMLQQLPQNAQPVQPQQQLPA